MFSIAQYNCIAQMALRHLYTQLTLYLFLISCFLAQKKYEAADLKGGINTPSFIFCSHNVYLFFWYCMIYYRQGVFYGGGFLEKDEKDYLCNCTVIHEDVVDQAKSKIRDDDTLYYMSEFFRMFGDATRLKIINALMISEMCVCDISALVGMSQSVISHHLKILRQARVIKFRREGKIVYYSICDEHIRLIFNQGDTHIRESIDKA